MAKATVYIEGQNKLKTPLKQAQEDISMLASGAQKAGEILQKAFTVTAIVAGMKALASATMECVNAFKLQQEADTRLLATIKATNSQYITSAAQMRKYASELQSVTRFEDDAIEATASMLLASQKFNEDGLKRTIELSADLAEAMRTDITSAAQTLEKALVDPGEGLTRLRTIGITFTDSEKDMIEQLKAAGKEFEAQKIILDKVEASYGGMAKSLGSIDTSVLDKISQVWGDLKEDLGDVFINTLGPIFDWIYQTLRWLERLANQVAERQDFNQALSGNNARALADNFTTDYLKAELEKRQKNYWKQVDSIYDEFHNTITSLETALEINFYDLVSMSRQDQKKVLDEYFNGDYWRYQALYTELGFLNEANVIKEALNLQENDKLVSLQLDAARKEQEAADALAKTLNSWKASPGASPYNWRGATASALSSGWGGFMLNAWTGTLSGANPMLGGYNMGLGITQTDTYFDKMYHWFDELGDSAKELHEKWQKVISASDDLVRMGTRRTAGGAVVPEVNGVSTGIQFGIGTPDFGLASNDTGLKPMSLVVAESGNLGIDSATGRAQAQARNAFAIDILYNSFGELGRVSEELVTNMSAMGTETAILMEAFKYIAQGLGEVLSPMLDSMLEDVINPLIEMGKAIGELILPVLQILAPILDMISKPVLVLAGTFQYVGQLLQHWVATIMNWMAGLNILGWQPFAGLRTTDPGAPGGYADYMTNYMGSFDAESTSTKTAVSSAAYRGATSVTINIYQQSPVVGDNGMRDFARMIREEFDELSYYGVTA